MFSVWIRIIIFSIHWFEYETGGISCGTNILTVINEHHCWCQRKKKEWTSLLNWNYHKAIYRVGCERYVRLLQAISCLHYWIKLVWIAYHYSTKAVKR